MARSSACCWRPAPARACEKCHVNFVRLVLVADADKNLSDHLDRTALMQAYGQAHVEIVQ